MKRTGRGVRNVRYRLGAGTTVFGRRVESPPSWKRVGVGTAKKRGGGAKEWLFDRQHEKAGVLDRTL